MFEFKKAAEKSAVFLSVYFARLKSGADIRNMSLELFAALDKDEVGFQMAVRVELSNGADLADIFSMKFVAPFSPVFAIF